MPTKKKAPAKPTPRKLSPSESAADRREAARATVKAELAEDAKATTSHKKAPDALKMVSPTGAVAEVAPVEPVPAPAPQPTVLRSGIPVA